MNIRWFQPGDEDTVVGLWDRCGLLRPWNDPRKDIARKVQAQPELFLVLEVDGALAGTVMAGYDGHRGWILGGHPKPATDGHPKPATDGHLKTGHQ